MHSCVQITILVSRLRQISYIQTHRPMHAYMHTCKHMASIVSRPKLPLTRTYTHAHVGIRTYTCIHMHTYMHNTT